MDLRFKENKYDGKITITNVYSDNDDSPVDLDEVNENFASDLKKARGAILGNRLGMLIAFLFFVFLPALLVSIFQENVLLIGVIVVYTILSYFVIEAINQVVINDFLRKVDNTFGH